MGSLFDKNLERALWHLIGGTRGGVTRARIINLLRDRPYNTNQLSEELEMDYKTIQYHLRILEKNGLVTCDDEEYGSLYHVDEHLQDNIDVFEEIWEKIDKDDTG